LPESLDRLDDIGSIASLQRQVTEPIPLLSDEKPVENLSRDQGSKHPCVGRRIDQPHQSHERFQQIGIPAD
jgi:hypothetical protein